MVAKYEFSIHAFLQHFKIQDKLDLPSTTQLVIKDIWVITGRTFLDENTKLLYRNTDKWISLIFNTILQIIGKTITIRGDASFSIILRRDFAVTFTNNISLISEKTNPLKIDLSYLFRTMVHISMSEINFDPSQNLEISFDGRDIKDMEIDQPVRLINKMIASGLPSGFSGSRHFQGDVKLCITFHQRENGPLEKCVSLSCSRGIRLSLNPQFEMLRALNFCKRLALLDEIKIPKSEKFLLQDPVIPILKKRYSDNPFLRDICHLSIFVLNQILLALGKTIKLDNCEKCVFDDNKILLESSKDFSLKLDNDDLFIFDLPELATNLIELGYHLEVEPQQGVYFISKKIDKVDKETLDKYILEHTPFNMKISINWDENITLTLLKDYGFKVTPKKGKLRLFAEWKSAVEIIESFLTPEISNLLAEVDTACFQFLIFKMIFYHICGDFKSKPPKELPPFFQESTRTEVYKFVNDPNFAVISIFLHGYQDTLKRLLSLSPIDFDKIDFDKNTNTNLPEQLLELILTVKSLVYAEIRNNSAITQSISEIAKKVREKDSSSPTPFQLDCGANNP